MAVTDPDAEGAPRPRRRLDRTLDQPLYKQVEEALRDEVVTGRWPAGTRVPPESELCDIYQVSRITVRQALRNLESQGLIQRGRGRGTFVRDPAIVTGARGLTSFTTEATQLGLRPGARTLDSAAVTAPEHIAQALDLDVADPVVRIRRLRTGDDQPVGVQTSWLRGDLVPGLEAEDLTDRSLYVVLQQVYGLTPVEAVETFRVTQLDEDDAALLEVPAGSCAFDVERITHGSQGPYEYVTSLMRGDRYLARIVLRAT